MCKLNIINVAEEKYVVYVDGERITKEPIAFSEIKERLQDIKLDESKKVIIEKFRG